MTKDHLCQPLPPETAASSACDPVSDAPASPLALPHSIPATHRHVASLRITATDEGWSFLHNVFVDRAEIPGVSIRCVAIGDVFAERDVLEDALKAIQFRDVEPYDAADYAQEALDRGQDAGGDGWLPGKAVRP